MRYKERFKDVYIKINLDFMLILFFLIKFYDNPPNEAILSGLAIFANPNDGDEENN